MESSNDVISQQELAEFEVARLEVRRARRCYECVRRAILRALESGAEVEPGPYRAFVRINARLAVE